MLRMEDKERKSESRLQEKRLAFQRGGPNESLKVDAAIQEGVVRRVGFTEDQIPFGVSLLRSAVALYPDLKEEAGYLKYNRAQKQLVPIGDRIELSTTIGFGIPFGNKRSFLGSSFVETFKGTVVIATSYS